MTVSVSAPVGRRWRTTNVANLADDQQNVIDLLKGIATSQGGKKEVWAVAPLAGPDGVCPPFLADAIWDFQVFWKSVGVFHVIDGVVDPGMHTIQQMNAVAVFDPSDALSADDLAQIIVDSFSTALSLWKGAAQLINVQIQAASAAGGTLLGPLLGPPMLTALARVPNSEDRKLVAGCASAITIAFLQWQSSTNVVGMAWYPDFNSVPSAFAPPTPNVPAPLTDLFGNAMMIEDPVTLRFLIGSHAAASQRADKDAVIASVAPQVSSLFTTFRGTTIVMNVIGSGPVPSFAPPLVNSGPVVGGVGNGVGVVMN